MRKFNFSSLNFKFFYFFIILFSLFLIEVAAFENFQRPLEYQSFLILDLSNFLSTGELKAKAIYYYSNFTEKKEGNFSTQSQKVEKKPAAGALVSFYINNQPIVDENGNVICSKLEADENGEVICKKALYILNPFSTSPKVLKVFELNTDLIITAKLEKSPKSPLIRPTTSEPFIISLGKSSSEAFFLSIQKVVFSPSHLPICLFLFLIGGIFFASMFYQGRNPFSVFDITVPIIPNVANPKVKPSIVSANLSIMRKEVMFQTRQIERLMRLNKIFLSRKDAMIVDRVLNRLKTKASLSPDEFRKFKEELSQISPRFGKIKKFYLDALDAWQALVAQLESVAFARAGPVEGRSFLYKLTSNLGKGLAKITSAFPFLRYVDKIPYVYRVRMVITNWIASREASRYMHRTLIKSLMANTIGKTKLAEKIGLSNLLKEYKADSKVVGFIPNIIDNYRLKSYKISDALTHKYLELFIISILRSHDKDAFKNGQIKESKELEKAHLLLKDLFEKAQQKAKEAIKNEQLSAELLNRLTSIYFAKELGNYMLQNKIPLFSSLGIREFSEKEIRQILKDLGSIQKVIVEDTKEARSLNTSSVSVDGSVRLGIKGFDPENVFERYNLLAKIIQRHAEDKNPLILIGRSLIEIFDKFFSNRAGEDIQKRYIFMLRKLEEETIKSRYLNFLLEKEAAFLDSKKIFQAGKVSSPLFGGNFSTWIKQIQPELSSKKIAAMAEYDKAAEWAARRAGSGFWRSKHSPVEEELRAKLLRLSDYYSYLFGGGVVDLFDKFDNNYRKDLVVYHSLKETFKIFFPGQSWNATTFNAWLERGVLFGDLKKAAFVNNAKMELLPLPSGFVWNEKGYVVGAYLSLLSHKDKSYLSYEVKNLIPVLFGSDYAERLIGLKIAVKTGEETFRIGKFTDPQVFKMWNFLDQEIKKFLQLSQFSRTEDKITAFKNIERLALQLNGHVHFVLTSYIMDGGRTLGENANLKISPFSSIYYKSLAPLENIFVGMSDLGWRLQEWYSAQAYARMVMYHFTENYNRGLYTYSESEKRELSFSSIQEAKKLEKYEKELSKVFDPGRFETQGLLNRFFNVAEQTVMRDPRITYGSGYGLDPAVMSGYPTGQYYPEHPRLYAFYEGIPGSRLAYPFFYIAYEIGRLFAIYNRPFFTLTVGYTSAYRYDPELGFPYGHHEKPSFLQTVRSLFRPSYSFDSLRIFGDMLATFGIKAKEFPTKYSFRTYISDLESGKDTDRFFGLIGSTFRDKYYVIENRTGRDITTAGGLHRPYELTASWETGSVVKRTLVPGMIHYDWDERWHLYPYAALNLTRPIPNSPLSKLTLISPQLELLARAGEIERYTSYSGLGTNFYAESVSTMYKINTSLITEYYKIQQTIQSFGFLNSPFVFPLAPIPVLAWQIMRRTIPSIRNQPYVALPPVRTSKKLTSEEQVAEMYMKAASQQALAAGEREYRCPTHHISVRAGTFCPLCYTSEEERASRFSYKFTNSILRKIYSTANTLKALNPFIEDHFLNTIYCSMHHIPFERGTVCPMCSVEKLRTQQGLVSSIFQLSELRADLKEINKEIKKVLRSSVDNEEKLAMLAELEKRKEELLKPIGLIDELDRSYNYHVLYESLYIQKERLRRKEREVAEELERGHISERLLSSSSDTSPLLPPPPKLLPPSKSSHSPPPPPPPPPIDLGGSSSQSSETDLIIKKKTNLSSENSEKEGNE
ncbi:MAG: hypothetical protein N3D10_01630 [Candidatus Micrarchaeota archaeon]|nr:hypothetical protein [Candidatus Micrarchaeota archaeon]